MPGWFQESCHPFSPKAEPCELGHLASYSINVTSVQQFMAVIKFCRDYNVRLVIKNTGHDSQGKSTGKGSLSLWMHSLKSINILDEYEASYYNGSAIRIEAGVLGLEVYEVADTAGYRVLGGNRPSVGIAGGYAQGGGHSGLSSLYGMAADNVLEWEVVTAAGEHLVASPTQNSDLYWARSGGGGSTFAVVISMTSRLHSDGPVGGGYLLFDNSTVGTDTFWDAVTIFNEKLPSMLDVGGITFAYGLMGNSFGIYNLVAPGRDSEQVRGILAPFMADLDDLIIPYNCITHESPSYLEQIRRDYGPLPDGPFPTSAILGGRLIPRTTFIDPGDNAVLTRMLRTTVQGGEFGILMHAIDVGSGRPLFLPPVADNAVLPAWRTASVQSIVTAAWDWTVPRAEMERRESLLADLMTPALVAVTLSSGTYMNEGNFREGDWKTKFYGTNYQRLLEFKKKYDPDHVFYATQTVGSDYWEEDEAGRLCIRSS